MRYYRSYLKNFLTKNFLTEHYTNKKKSLLDIAKEVGCSKRTVLRAIRRYHIVTRSISEGTKLNTPRGKFNWMYNKVFVGPNAFAYKDGRTPLYTSIRNLKQNDEWRISVFKRDDYRCQECFKREIYLHAHHNNKSFSQIFEEFLQEYNQFSPIEDKETLVRLAINYKPFWNIDNGKTICRKCHKKYTTRPDRSKKYAK